MTIFDPITTPADIEILPPSIQADRLMQGLLQTHQRFFENDLNDVILYDFANTLSTVLGNLSADFFVTGYRGWFLAEDDAARRELLANAIALHKTAGTAHAIKLAMQSIGFPNATVTENPPLRYDGTVTYSGRELYAGQRLGAFIVTLDPIKAPVSQQQIDLIFELVNVWKNARSELVDLRIGNVSLLENLFQYDGTESYDGSQSYTGIKNITFESLLSVALSNNATHLWQGEDYLIGGWADKIATDTLTHLGPGVASIQSTGADQYVEFIAANSARMSVLLPVAAPYEYLFASRIRTITNNDVLLVSNSSNQGALETTATNYEIFGTSANDSGIALDTNWQIIYCKFDSDGTVSLKVGSSSVYTASDSTFTPDRLNIAARAGGSRFIDIDYATILINTAGNWTNGNINAIATQIQAEYPTINPAWSALS